MFEHVYIRAIKLANFAYVRFNFRKLIFFQNRLFYICLPHKLSQNSLIEVRHAVRAKRGMQCPCESRISFNLVLRMSATDDADFLKVRLLRGKWPVFPCALTLVVACISRIRQRMPCYFGTKKNSFKRKDKNPFGFQPFTLRSMISSLLIIAILLTSKLYHLTRTLHNIIKFINFPLRKNFSHARDAFRNDRKYL